ncbi:MAG: class IV adenylate cyclase [Planctomycetota bacterium]|jgi:adenylate cyclase class 2
MSITQSFEVEQKFPLSGNVEDFVKRLLELGAEEHGEIQQSDRYFNHPVRDFAVTDEALRIRSVGDQNWLTWKGPKIDAQTKTRREIELPLGDGALTTEQLVEVLQILAFHPVAVVSKVRRTFALSRDAWEFEIAVDDVQEVGAFAEIELVASQERLAAAQQAVIQLGEELGLSQMERRSYLALLLEGQGRTDDGE